MADAAYEAAVKETFETKPLRTVLMIDDEFPSFTDLATGETKENAQRFRQKPLAEALYRGFKKCHMICDIENSVTDDGGERFRKSDLIILDYHLGPGSNNSEQSIKLLRELAHSKHFNTIVVYTQETDLDRVWLEVIACIRGGWASLPATLADLALTEWDRIADENPFPEAPTAAVMRFASRGKLSDVLQHDRAVMVEELEERGVQGAVHDIILEARLYSALAKVAGDYAKAGGRSAVGGVADGVRWIQSENAFIAIMNKADLRSDGKEPIDEKDPVGIMAGLRKALLAWQPSFVQILVSEVQNVLELDALATADSVLRKPDTQAALWYYLLQSLGKLDLANPLDVTSPIVAIIDRILDGIRQKLVSDNELLSLASNALIGNLRETGWTFETWPAPSITLFDGAADLARVKGLVDLQGVMFRLNAFFATEEFSRPHLTTGTVFKHVASNTHWVAASPACDLEDRSPGAHQVWAKSIDPVTAVIGLRLEPYHNIDKALKEATTARFVFLETGAGERKVFKLVDDSGAPSYEVFFAQERGKIVSDGARKTFKAGRLVVSPEHPTGVVAVDEFEIVHQLRGLNASRTLHVAGQHLSRIGVDFVAMPKT